VGLACVRLSVSSFPLTYPTGDPNIQFRIELGPPRWSGRRSSRRKPLRHTSTSLYLKTTKASSAVVAFREQSWGKGTLSVGRVPGGQRNPAARQATAPSRLPRHHLPGVRIRVRLDGGFTHPALLALLDAQPRLEYVVAMAKNAVLKRVAETRMRRARQLSRGSGKTEQFPRSSKDSVVPTRVRHESTNNVQGTKPSL
jgi:hypothetical protein